MKKLFLLVVTLFTLIDLSGQQRRIDQQPTVNPVNGIKYVVVDANGTTKLVDAVTAQKYAMPKVFGISGTLTASGNTNYLGSFVKESNGTVITSYVDSSGVRHTITNLDSTVFARKSEIPNFLSSTHIIKNGNGSASDPYNFSVTGQILDSVFVPKTAVRNRVFYFIAPIPSTVPSTATYAGYRNVDDILGRGTAVYITDTLNSGVYWSSNTPLSSVPNSMIAFGFNLINNTNYVGTWIYFKRNIFRHVSSINGKVGDITGVSSINNQTGDIIINVKDTAVYGSANFKNNSPDFGSAVGDYVQFLESEYINGATMANSVLTVAYGDKTKTYNVGSGFVGIPVFPQTTPQQWLTLAPVSVTDNYTKEDCWDTEISFDRRTIKIRVRRLATTNNTVNLFQDIYFSIRGSGNGSLQWNKSLGISGNDVIPLQGIYSTTPLVTYRGNTTLQPVKNNINQYSSSLYTYPDRTFKIVGTIRTDTLEITTNAGTGKVLTSDANGVASWQSNCVRGVTENRTVSAGGGTNFIVSHAVANPNVQITLNSDLGQSQTIFVGSKTNTNASLEYLNNGTITANVSISYQICKND